MQLGQCVQFSPMRPGSSTTKDRTPLFRPASHIQFANPSDVIAAMIESLSKTAGVARDAMIVRCRVAGTFPVFLKNSEL
jgi:hypothetical protein